MEAHEKVAPSVIWSIIAAGMIVALAPSLGPTYGGICQSALNWRFNFIFTLPCRSPSSSASSRPAS